MLPYIVPDLPNLPFWQFAAAPSPQETLLEKLLPLIIGFVLTTVCGGVLGWYFQDRIWNHQWQVQRHAQMLESTTRTFEEISRLMDKRLFRLCQFYLWTRRQNRDLQLKSLEEYRKILTEWNDSINRHLSMLQFYFGERIREEFDYGVGKKFVVVGAMVERLYRDQSQDPKLIGQIDNGIEELRSEVYRYNLELLSFVRQIKT